MIFANKQREMGEVFFKGIPVVSDKNSSYVVIFSIFLKNKDGNGHTSN